MQGRSLMAAANATWRSVGGRAPARPSTRCQVGALKQGSWPSRRKPGPVPGTYDLVLSSGYLAFASHAGFLHACEEAGLRVGGVMGTSAGALSGSLYCAGYTAAEVAQHLSAQRPAELLRPSLAPWKGGVLSLEGVIERLRELLPPNFEDLDREFAVGVVTAAGEHMIIDSGPLPEAVAASAAIPFLFEAVEVPGVSERHGLLLDGGVADRMGLKAWRDRRRRQQLELQQRNASRGLRSPTDAPPHTLTSTTTPNPHALASTSRTDALLHRQNQHHQQPQQLPACLVHLVGRSSPFSGDDDAAATGERNVAVFHSPKAEANLLDLGFFEAAVRDSWARARGQLQRIRHGAALPQGSHLAVHVPPLAPHSTGASGKGTSAGAACASVGPEREQAARQEERQRRQARAARALAVGMDMGMGAAMGAGMGLSGVMMDSVAAAERVWT